MISDNRIGGAFNLVNVCYLDMCFQLGMENKRRWRDKTERRAGKELGKEDRLFIYARGARQVTCADGQSSQISLIN